MTVGTLQSSKTDLAIPVPLLILNVPVTPFMSYEHATSCILNRISNRQKTLCVAVNPEKVYAAAHNPKLSAVITNADVRLCDGIGIVYAAKLLFGIVTTRCTGIELFFKLIQKASEKQLKIFLLGASEKSNEAACMALTKKCPGLIIAGRHHGYFDDSSAAIEKINWCCPDMLFVALGSPKQEFWLYEHKNEINAPFCMGIGGTLDCLSGKTKWAPKFFRKTGTEFLYRLITEPKRWKRQLALPQFVLMVLQEKLFGTNYS